MILSPLIGSVFKKLKSSLSFEALTKWFSKPSLFSSEEEKENFRKELELSLVKLDFKLELAEEISHKTIEELKVSKEPRGETIKKKLIEVLVEHYKGGFKLSQPELKFRRNECTVFFISGSNGTGKTSSIAKLVYYLKIQKKMDKKILLVAGDTFRAGAVEQLGILGNKLGVDVISPTNEKEKASALIYRALTENKDKYDLIILDSSGRQYNNQNLMQELKKQYSIIEKILGRVADESLVVIDSTLGMYSQLELEKLFSLIPVTGIILTKLDNTSRGGVIYNLRPKYLIPIKFICFGEKLENIELFEPKAITTQLIDSVFKLS